MGPIRADEVSSTVGTSVREWDIQVENSSVLALYSFRQQGWRGGGSTRRHMWVEFVGFLLCSERFFPRYSGFPHSSKTII